MFMKWTLIYGKVASWNSPEKEVGITQMTTDNYYNVTV